MCIHSRCIYIYIQQLIKCDNTVKNNPACALLLCNCAAFTKSHNVFVESTNPKTATIAALSTTCAITVIVNPRSTHIRCI